MRLALKRAEGECYRDSFGGWACPLFLIDNGEPRYFVPPRAP